MKDMGSLCFPLSKHHPRGKNETAPVRLLSGDVLTIQQTDNIVLSSFAFFWVGGGGWGRASGQGVEVGAKAWPVTCFNIFCGRLLGSSRLQRGVHVGVSFSEGSLLRSLYRKASGRPIILGIPCVETCSCLFSAFISFSARCQVRVLGKTFKF